MTVDELHQKAKAEDREANEHGLSLGGSIDVFYTAVSPRDNHVKLITGKRGSLHNGSCDSDFKYGANQNGDYCFPVKTIDYMRFRENNNPLSISHRKEEKEEDRRKKEASLVLHETVGTTEQFFGCLYNTTSLNVVPAT